MRHEEIRRAVRATGILELFARDSWIERRPGGWWVCWVKLGAIPSNRVEKRYATMRGTHFPLWYKQWPHGGTACIALEQLIRWCRGQSVLPLSAWEYWASDEIGLIKPCDIEKLRDIDWPESVKCVLCGSEISKANDWWDVSGVSGPMCSRFSTCVFMP